VARDTKTARQEQRQQTRSRLIDAALRIFAEQGYDHATVEEISLAAGYSKGAYYFHFDSKEDIFIELLEHWVEEQTARFLSFRKVGTESTVALLGAVESVLRYDDSDPYWQLLLPEIWAQSNRNEKVKRALEDAYIRWARILEDAFEKAEGEGTISLSVRPALAASLVLAARDGLALHSRLKPEGGKQAESSQIFAGLLTTLLALSEQGAIVPPAKQRTIRRKRPTTR